MANRARQQQQIRLSGRQLNSKRNESWLKSIFTHIAAALIFALAANAETLPIPPEEYPLPFKEGENLVFDISWMTVVAGEGKLHVKKRLDYNGSDVLKINISSKSTGWVRKLHKVDDTTFTYFDIDKRYSHMADIRISEGRYRKHKVITFDQKSHKALYKVNAKEPKEFDIAPNSQDALSALYFLRTMRGKLLVGKTVLIPMFDDKKKYMLEVEVLRKERIKLTQGMVDTIVVQPFLKSEGVFQRKGKMWIWLTDDEFLTPVKIRSKILIGSFYATLRHSSGVDINYIPYKKKPKPKKQ